MRGRTWPWIVAGVSLVALSLVLWFTAFVAWPLALVAFVAGVAKRTRWVEHA